MLAQFALLLEVLRGKDIAIMKSDIPLVIVACEKEGMGLVHRRGLQRDVHLRFPGCEREEHAGFYRGTDFHLAITDEAR